MDVILDTFIVLGKCLYYFLESLFYKIIPKSKKDVAGEIVLITGAGGGIGRLMAIKFASLGVILVLWDINEESNMETHRLAEEKGGEEVFAYKCNCSNRQEVNRVADQVKEEVGDVTILINKLGSVGETISQYSRSHGGKIISCKCLIAFLVGFLEEKEYKCSVCHLNGNVFVCPKKHFFMKSKCDVHIIENLENTKRRRKINQNSTT